MTLLLAILTGQTDPSTMPVLEYGDALGEAVAVVGGLKGATAVGIAMAVVQILMLALRTKLAEFTGLWRWFVYSGLSLVAIVLATKVSGASWTGALLAAPTMTALGNWLHQIPMQAKKASDDKAADSAPPAAH